MYQLNELLGNRKRILVTGGAGFIGSALICRLLDQTSAKVFNLDKLTYSSDFGPIEEILNCKGKSKRENYTFLKANLSNMHETTQAVKIADPDLVMHLAAESHVDRSIKNPTVFIHSNINGTFNLLEALRHHYQCISSKRKKVFRFHHVSTDEVFGSLDNKNKFSEKSQYDPRSPYSASKAASDHLVRAWHYTYGMPVIITNCSNNFGPWQHPDKLISLAITNAITGNKFGLYGDGLHIRDWLYIEDHIDGLLIAANKGLIGHSYCIGGDSERTNQEVLKTICAKLDRKIPKDKKHSELIFKVKDRAGHDRRYSVDHNKITKELGWKPKHTFEEGIDKTLNWYIKNIEWAKSKRDMKY